MANFFCSVVHPPWRYCFSGFGRPDGGKLMGDMLLRDAKGASYPPPSMLTGLPPTGLTSRRVLCTL
ncbi:unnamed protein product [Brassica oleracea var. botrytis]